MIYFRNIIKQCICNSSKNILSAYEIGTILSTLHILSQLILTIIYDGQEIRYYYFPTEEMEDLKI